MRSEAPAATPKDGGGATAPPRPRGTPAAGEVGGRKRPFVSVRAPGCHDGLMMKNILESVAGHVFPTMSAISPGGHAGLGDRDVWVSEKPGCAVLTVTSDRGVLFQIMVSPGRVEAARALPVESGGTAWARFRRWVATDDTGGVAREIRGFFEET